MVLVLLSLLINSLVVGALVALFIAAKPLRRKLRARGRLALWLMLAAVLVAPIGILARFAPLQIELSSPTVMVESPFQTAEPSVDGHQGPESAAAGEVSTSEISYPIRTYYKFNIVAASVAVWLLGSLSFLAFEGLRYLCWRRFVWRWRTAIGDGEVFERIEQVRQDMNCQKPLVVYHSPAVRSAVIVGLNRPKLLLPEDFTSDASGEMVLRHEITHIKYHDVWKKLLLLLVQCFHWFNPFVWVLVNHARRDIEIACDEHVVEGHNHAYRVAYSETLLQSASKARFHLAPALSTSFGSDKKSLMERFRCILDTGKKHKGRVALVACLLAVLIALNLFFIRPATRQAVALSVPQSGSNFTLQVGGSSGETVETPIPLPDLGDEQMRDQTLREYSAAGIGRFLSVAVGPGQFNTETVKLYTSGNGGGTWAETAIDVSGHMDFGGPIWHGYVTRQNGHLFVQGAKGSTLNNGVYLYQTVDGGKEWQVRCFVPRQGETTVAAGFIDETTGFICYNAKDRKPLVLVTQDGGDNWNPVEGLLPLLAEASGLPPEDDNAFYLCKSAQFIDGASLTFLEQSTGTTITLHTGNGINWETL